MTEEKYTQSRNKPERNKAVNPLDAFDADDAAAVMARVKEMEKQMPLLDPVTRQPKAGEGVKMASANQPTMPFAMQGQVPPEVAQMFNKDSRASQPQPQPQEKIIKTVQTNNPKLNDLLERLKPITGQYEECRLPSLSKFYQDGEAPENGIIHLRPMTGEEEEVLSTQRLLKKGHAINMVFRNCIRENINPEKWLTIDRTHVLIYLRGISQGPQYQVELKCPLCSHRHEATLNLDLPVKYCPKNYGLDNLRGVLPASGYKFSFRLPTVHDETLMNNYMDKKKKDDSNRPDDSFVWRTAYLLEEIEGLDTHAELMTLIEKLPIADVSHLRDIMNDIPFGAETKITQWCPGCAEDFEVELPIETGFFFPQRKKENHHQANN